MKLMQKLQTAAAAVQAMGKTLLGLDRPQLYRPEAHYMRGPGPKWRARHGDPRAFARTPQRRDTRRTV